MRRKVNIVIGSMLVMTLLAGCSVNNASSNSAISGSRNSAAALADASTPKPERSGDTALTFTPDPQKQQTVYLWEKGSMPTETTYTENNGGYFDNPNFRPNLVTIPAKKGANIKGAVLICSGGAFQVRSNEHEAMPTAEALSELGYQCCVVNYRVRPYTMEEGSLDLARAVRFVRAHAVEYGIKKNDIAVMGFSAGGILCGDLLLNFDGTVNGTALDPNYASDDLDKISADASAVGMIYSFYGRLALASTDVKKFAASDLPPAYFVYGTKDPFADDFPACAQALRKAGVSVEEHVLQGWPHGFGADGDWIPGYDRWLTKIFQNN